MITDSARMSGYVQALRQAIKPGAVVLDIGTGTGIFAMLACQFGARRVYGVEPDDAIQIAKEIAAANELDGRIEFIQDLSTRITLPEQADVIVSDMRGVLSFFQNHIPSLIDARKRLLVPGGTLIPLRDTMWASVVDAPDLYDQYKIPWRANDYGLDMRAAHKIVVNTWRKSRVRPEQLLLEPQCWATLDYNTIENPDVSAELVWTAKRAGTAHAIIAWFDASLIEGVGFSNAPGEPELIYGNALFPLYEPVAIAADDRVSLILQGDLVEEDYIWRWNTRILDQNDPRAVKADFKQSTFFGAPLSPARLRKRASNYAPALDEEGEIDRFILSEMDGQTSLDEIARRISDRFPARFKTSHDALSRIGDLSLKYSR